MKFLRITLAVVVVLVMTLSYLPRMASAVTAVPSKVRIGLLFEDNSHQAASEVKLIAPQGFEIGEQSGDTFTTLLSVEPNVTAVITVDGANIQASAAGKIVTSQVSPNFTVKPKGAYVTLVNKNRSYRGLLDVLLRNGKLWVINEVGTEDYLYGVVPKEMSESWPKEALKVQAVAARTYVAANVGRYGNLGFDLTDDQYSQAYGGVGSEGSNSRAAVDETRGQILIYGGRPISAVYHSNSGGYTENSENVWVSSLPYLRAVADPYSLGVGSSKDQWQVTYTKEYLANLINKKQNIGEVVGITVLEKGPSGRLTKVRVDGTLGSTIIEKDLIRYYLGNLDSTLFEIFTDSDVNLLGSGSSQTVSRSLAGKYVVRGSGEVTQLSDAPVTMAGSTATKQTTTEPSQYTFKGKGWGHGVGMSQWGAYGMAKTGKGYAEILAHYYQGAQLSQ